MNKTPLTALQKTLNVWAVVVVIWSFYRANFRVPEYLDELIVKPLVFLGVLHIYFKYFQKRSLKEIINIKLLKSSEFVLFLVIACAFIFTALGGNYFKNNIWLSGEKLYFLLSSRLIIAILMSFFTSFTEETLSIAFVFPKMLEEWKNVYLASFLNGLLFAVLHIPMLVANLKLDGYTIVILLASNLILGCINALLYSENRNLLFPILVHMSYNFSVLLFI